MQEDGRSNEVGIIIIIVNVEISKEVIDPSTTGDMAGEDHCSLDDDPPTDGMYHLRLRTPDGWDGGREGGFRRRGGDVGWSERRPDDSVRCRRF